MLQEITTYMFFISENLKLQNLKAKDFPEEHFESSCNHIKLKYIRLQHQHFHDENDFY